MAARGIFYTATTLDGFIADDHDSLDWLFVQDIDQEGPGGYTPFIAGMGAMVMGSTTYLWLRDHLGQTGEAWSYDIPCWVFTHRELPAIPNADIRFVQGDVTPVHEEMRAAADGKNIWLVGGGELVGLFADAGLLDEIQLHVAPVTLGGGAPLLPRRITAPRLTLQRAEEEGGFAYLTYSVSRP